MLACCRWPAGCLHVRHGLSQTHGKVPYHAPQVGSTVQNELLQKLAGRVGVQGVGCGVSTGTNAAAMLDYYAATVSALGATPAAKVLMVCPPSLRAGASATAQVQRQAATRQDQLAAEVALIPSVVAAAEEARPGARIVYLYTAAPPAAGSVKRRSLLQDQNAATPQNTTYDGFYSPYKSCDSLCWVSHCRVVLVLVSLSKAKCIHLRLCLHAAELICSSISRRVSGVTPTQVHRPPRRLKYAGWRA
jgi:hypothetical protein